MEDTDTELACKGLMKVFRFGGKNEFVGVYGMVAEFDDYIGECWVVVVAVHMINGLLEAYSRVRRTDLATAFASVSSPILRSLDRREWVPRTSNVRRGEMDTWGLNRGKESLDGKDISDQMVRARGRE